MHGWPLSVSVGPHTNYGTFSEGFNKDRTNSATILRYFALQRNILCLEYKRMQNNINGVVRKPFHLQMFMRNCLSEFVVIDSIQLNFHWGRIYTEKIEKIFTIERNVIARSSKYRTIFKVRKDQFNLSIGYAVLQLGGA